MTLLVDEELLLTLLDREVVKDAEVEGEAGEGRRWELG